MTREGEALHRRNPDPEPGEGSWPGGDGKELDLAQRDAGGFADPLEVSRQPLPVRQRRIPDEQLEHLAAAQDRETAIARRRVESEDQHESECYTRPFTRAFFPSCFLP